MTDPSINPFAAMDPNRPVPASTGFEGLPGASSFFGQAAYGQVNDWMQNSGYQPMGISGQGLLDQQRNQQFLQKHNDMLTAAAEAEKPVWARTMRGAFRAGGAEWGAEQEQALQTGLSKITPFIGSWAASNPAAVNFAGGARGSAIPMMSQMMLGSRNRFDPVTGEYGMGRDSMGSMLNTMTTSFNRDDTTDLKGFGGQGMGDMSQFLLSRGMLGGGGGIGTTVEGLRGLKAFPEHGLGRAQDRMGVTAGSDIDSMLPSQLRKLSADPEVLEQLRSDPAAVERMQKFDSTKTKDSIKGYLDAASAIGEIFGDPQAGIPALMDALEKFVGPSAMAQLKPEQLAGMVRQTGELAKVTNISMEAAKGMQAHAMNQATRYGLQGFQGIDAAQDAMAFAGALRGSDVGSSTFWGARSTEQLVQARMHRTLSATGSEQANRLGAFMRIGETVGFDTEEAKDLQRIIKNKTLSSTVSEEEVTRLLSGEGMTRAQAGSAYAYTAGNAEYVTKNELGKQISRRLLPGDVEKNMAINIGTSVSNFLEGKIEKGEVAGISSSIMRELMDLSSGDRTDPDKVNKTVAVAMRAEMGDEEFEAAVSGTPAERAKKIRIFTQDALGRLNTFMDADTKSGAQRFGGSSSWNQEGRMSDKDLQARTGQLSTLAEVRGVASKELASLGRHGFATRFIDALADSPDGDFADILKNTLGNKKSETRDKIVTAFEPLRESAIAMAKIRKQARTETDPVKQQALREAANAKEEALRLATLSVAKNLDMADIDPMNIELSAKAKEKAEADKKKTEENEKLIDGTGTETRDTTADGDKKNQATLNGKQISVRADVSGQNLKIDGRCTIEGNDLVIDGTANILGADGPGAP